MNNDIYTTKLDGTPHTRVTFDGSATVRSGVPDWVFEGTIFIYINIYINIFIKTHQYIYIFTYFR